MVATRCSLAAVEDSEAAPIRVLIVDDSPVQRRFLRAALEAVPDFAVAAETATGEEAVELVSRLSPAAVLMDSDLPRMDGLTAIEKIMAEAPTPVVVYSAHVPDGSPNAKAALAAGAVRVLCKPGPDNALSLDQLSENASRSGARGQQSDGDPPLAGPTGLQRARHGTGAPTSATAPGQNGRPGGRPGAQDGRRRATAGGHRSLDRRPARTGSDLECVACRACGPSPGGAAHGGRLHQQPRSLANRVCPFDVSIAMDGQRLRPGMVPLAPTGCDVVVEPGLVIRCREPEPGQLNVPSVDVTFASVACAVGASAVGVVLTGMGRDGAAGSRALHDRGAVLVGQDEGSCVVYGMPAAARAAGALDRLLPLDDIVNAHRADRMSRVNHARDRLLAGLPSGIPSVDVTGVDLTAVAIGSADEDAVRCLLAERCGLVIEDARRDVLLGAMRARMAAVGQSEAAIYAEGLRADAAELGELVEHLVVSEIYFFGHRRSCGRSIRLSGPISSSEPGRGAGSCASGAPAVPRAKRLTPWR